MHVSSPVSAEMHGHWNQLDRLSTKGGIMDTGNLRIDAGEKSTATLADAVLAPSDYMNAWHRLRGWRLPPQQETLLNIMPNSKGRKEGLDKQPIKRLVFYARLEERKGIIVFMNLVEKLKSEFPDIGVWIVGPEGFINGIPSKDWMAPRMANWTFPYKLMTDVDRERGNELLQQPGNLVILCSLLENLPYAVAEAAMLGVPFIAFDTGGIRELLSDDSIDKVLVSDVSFDALQRKVADALRAGTAHTAVLGHRASHADTLWLEWHERQLAEFPARKKADIALANEVNHLMPDASLSIVSVAPNTSSMHLWQQTCGSAPVENASDALLLVPSEFSVMDIAHHKQRLLELSARIELLHQETGVVALALGVELPDGRQFFPMTPTWMVYNGSLRDACVDNVPLMVPRRLFCRTFFGPAKVWKHYSAWVYSMMMQQQGFSLATYPMTVFKLTNFSMTGPSCDEYQPPAHRQVPNHIPGMMFSNAEQVMLNDILTKWPRPLASLQGDELQYGFYNATGYHPLRRAGTKGHQACPMPQFEFPFVRNELVHPCAAEDGSCCGGRYAASVIRFTSHTLAPAATVLVKYTAAPNCGDGVKVELVHIKAEKAGRTQLHGELFAPSPPHIWDPRTRSLVEKIALEPDDRVELVVDPLETMHCDGINLQLFTVWQQTPGSFS